MTAALLVGAGGVALAQTGEQSPGYIIFVNGFPEGGPVPAVDFQADGEVVATGVEPGATASPRELPPGEYVIEVIAPGQPDAVIVEGLASVASARTVVFSTYLDGADDSFWLSDDVSPTELGEVNGAEFYAANSAQAPTLAFSLSGDEAQKGLPVGAGERLSIGPGSHSVTAVVAETGEVLGQDDGIEVSDGDVLVALLTGTRDGGYHLVTFVVQSEEPGARGTSRLAGPDRLSTAVAISQEEFRDGAEVVYLARADVFADALAGGSLTTGPILLVPQCDGVPTVVANEIARLDPETVTALGGGAAVCDDTLTEAAEG